METPIDKIVSLETKSTKRGYFSSFEYLFKKKNLCVRRVALCRKNRRVLHRHDQIHLYRDRTATVAATLETATVTTTLETAIVTATPETAIVTPTPETSTASTPLGLSLFSDRRMQPQRDAKKKLGGFRVLRQTK
ncbi:hypothetical protein ACSQ67_021023 [Phaseolus vulgaris]